MLIIAQEQLVVNGISLHFLSSGHEGEYFAVMTLMGVRIGPKKPKMPIDKRDIPGYK
jgi:hypothetical protein